jgi:hypothetical protein
MPGRQDRRHVGNPATHGLPEFGSSVHTIYAVARAQDRTRSTLARRIFEAALPTPLYAVARAQDRTRSTLARRIFEAALTNPNPDTAVPPAAGAAGTGVVMGAGPPAHFSEGVTNG